VKDPAESLVEAEAAFKKAKQLLNASNRKEIEQFCSECRFAQAMLFQAMDLMEKRLK